MIEALQDHLFNLREAYVDALDIGDIEGAELLGRSIRRNYERLADLTYAARN